MSNRLGLKSINIKCVAITETATVPIYSVEFLQV